MASEIVRKLVDGQWATVAAESGSGGAAVTVTDGTTTVDDVTEIELTGATVSSGGAGVAEIATVSVRIATVTLTDAQIKALPTTPVTLVAAQGAGTTIVVVSALVRIDTSANGYDNFDAASHLVLTFEGEDISAAQGLLGAQNLEDLFSAFDNQVMPLGPFTTATADVAEAPPSAAAILPTQMSVADITNKALQLKVSNGAAGNFTEGDAANTGSVTVLYMVVEL